VLLDDGLSVCPGMLPRSHMKFQCHAHKDLEPGNYNVKLYDRLHGGSLPHGSADLKAQNKAGAWLLTQVRIIPLEQVLLVPDEGNDSISPSKVGSPRHTRGWWPTADWSSDQTGVPTSMTRGAELRTQIEKKGGSFR